MAINPIPLSELEHRHMSRLQWVHGGAGLPLLFAVAEAPEFLYINFDLFWDVVERKLDPNAAGLQTLDGTVNRDAEGSITSVVVGTVIKTITRDAEGNVEAVDDGVRQITLTRDAQGNISGWLAEVL